MRRWIALVLFLMAAPAFAATDLLDDGMTVADPNFTLSTVVDLSGGRATCWRDMDGTVNPDPNAFFGGFFCDSGGVHPFYAFGGGVDAAGNSYAIERVLNADTMVLVKRTTAGVESNVLTVAGCGALSGGTRLVTRISNIAVNPYEGAIYLAVRVTRTTNCYSSTGVEQAGVLKLTGAVAAGTGPFLPLAGGTMTGAITTKTGGDVIDVPSASGATQYGAIVFRGPSGGGVVDPAHWRQYVHSLSLSSHDKALLSCFNCKSSETGSFVRDVEGVHAVRVAYESRFHATDPANVRGAFEFNIDIDRGTTGAINFADRPFFFAYNMDTDALKRRTYWSMGLDGDTRSGFYEMGSMGQVRIQSGTHDSGGRQKIILEGPTVVGDAGADTGTDARLFVDGTANEVQLRAQCASGQTQQLFRLEADGAVPVTFSYCDGHFFTKFYDFAENDDGIGCAADEFWMYADNSEDRIKQCQNGALGATVVPMQALGTVAEDLADPAGACIEGSAVTITSAAFGDGCVLGTSEALPAGVTGTCRVTAANTVRASLCGTGNPAATITYTLRLIR